LAAQGREPEPAEDSDMVPGEELQGGQRESATLRTANRRTFLRVDVDLEVSLGVEAGHFTAQCANLCPGGVLISTFRTLRPGSAVSVEFDLPASRVVTQGVVLWSREATRRSRPGYGIAFTELTRFDRTLIEAFCTALAPDAYARISAPDQRIAG